MKGQESAMNPKAQTGGGVNKLPWSLGEPHIAPCFSVVSSFFPDNASWLHISSTLMYEIIWTPQYTRLDTVLQNDVEPRKTHLS